MIQSVTLSPGASTWLNAATEFSTSRPAQARDFRATLDLLTDGLVIMSGHQAELWHAGILAKWIAMTAAAEAARPDTPSESVWLVVDQDDNDPATIRYPTHNGRVLGEAIWKLSSPTLVAPGTPTADRPPLNPADQPTWKSNSPPADGDTMSGLERIGQALTAFKTTRSAAEQLGLCAAQFCRWYELEGSQPTELLMASDLARTAAFKSIIEKMIADPGACVMHYNQSITVADQADLRPLQINTARNRYELPLWLLTPGEPRKRIFSDDLAALPKDQWERLAPRAILMTGIVRAFACDLFIHGAGGGKYDSAAEAWFKNWLGLTLCPKVIASATVLLPLADKPVPTEQDVNRAWAKAHKARHDPSVLGDHAAAATLQKHLQALAAAKEAKQPRRGLYLRMQADLETYREDNKALIDRLMAEAAQTAQQASESKVATDRTWPFPLHGRAVITELRDRVRGQFESP